MGEEHEQRNIAAALLDLGYERTEQVDALGQFCLRGDILDVYPINSSAAVRIEWFDNELDAMRSFDVDTQRSLQTLTSIKIAPLKVDESFSYDADIFEYCAADTMVVVDEPVHVFSMLEKLDKENKEHASELFNKQELIEQLAANGQHTDLLYGNIELIISGISQKQIITVDAVNLDVFYAYITSDTMNLMNNIISGLDIRNGAGGGAAAFICAAADYAGPCFFAGLSAAKGL